MRNTEINKTSILFVCLGNICRSPAGEEVMKQILISHKRIDDFVVDSCGIGGWHIGHLPDKRMIMLGKKRGYNFTHLARQLTREDFVKFDFILGMDDEIMTILYSKARTKEEKDKIIPLGQYITKFDKQSEIPDPYYGKEEDFIFALDLLENACEEFYNKVLKQK